MRRDSLAVTLVLGKPIAQGHIGKIPVQLLLDTGAMSNNLNTKFIQALASAVRPRVLSPDRVIGPSSQQAAQRAILPELQLLPTAW